MDAGSLIDLFVALVFVGVAVALSLLRRSSPTPTAIPPAVTFCLLRAAELVAGVVLLPDETLLHALRAASVAALGWLLAALVRTLTAQARESRRASAVARAAHHARLAAASAQDEYERARHDYLQLVRHRIANPITAVIGGLQTLEAVDLPAGQRRCLLHSTLEQAQRLATIMLDPATLHPEERDLQPLPQLPDPADDGVASDHDRARAELDARALNLELAVVSARDGFMCECFDSACTAALEIDLADYLAVHAGDDDRFVVAPGHVDERLEQVVERRQGWWVVRKERDLVDEASDPG